MTEEELRLAELVRQACIRAVLDGYEQATISGLCHEGAFEVAIGQLRMLDLAGTLAQPEQVDE
ncbi:MAG: hypothetical protein WCX90_07010 [Thiohalomonadaceae bacterium]